MNDPLAASNKAVIRTRGISVPKGQTAPNPKAPERIKVEIPAKPIVLLRSIASSIRAPELEFHPIIIC